MTDAAPALPTLTMSDIKFEKDASGGNKVVVRARLLITDMRQVKSALTLLSSVELKNQMYDGRHTWGLSDYGIERVGSPHAYVLKGTYDRNNGTPDGYEQEFRFNRRG